MAVDPVVIDDHGHVGPHQQRRGFRQNGDRRDHLDMPAHRARDIGHRPELARELAGGRLAGAVEIDAQAAHAALGIVLEHGLRGLGRIDHGDAAAARAERVEAFEQHRIVGAVEARLHDDEARDVAHAAAARMSASSEAGGAR